MREVVDWAYEFVVESQLVAQEPLFILRGAVNGVVGAVIIAANEILRKDKEMTE